jgi:hypothetical protein
MRRSLYGFSLVGVTGLLCLLLSAGASSTTAAKTDELFSVREYSEFHHVLHPLQHEALPAKDFSRIRSNAAEMVKRGTAIIRVGVPQGTPETSAEEFRKELKKFEGALGSFSRNAKDGTDTELETSFSAVRDSFEMLVGMLPRK